MRFFIFCWLLLASPVLAAPKDIEFWHSMAGDKGQLLAEIVADFNKQSPDRKKYAIKLQFIGSYEEGINKLRTAMMGQQGPHLMQVYEIGTQVLVDSGQITPLHEFIAKDKTFPLAELLGPIRRYYEIDGKLFSLPFATSNPIVYINQDWLTQAGVKTLPETFAELEAVAKTLTDKAAKKTTITWPLHSWIFEQFLARQGKDLLGNSNGRKGRAVTTNYTSPEAVKFVSLWADLVKKGHFANVGRGWDPAEQNFLAGRSAMLVTSTSDVFEISNKAGFKISTAPIFKFKKGDPKGGTVVGGNSLWILKNKPMEEQTFGFSFFKYMASKDIQKKWHSKTGYFPIRQDAIDELTKEGFYKKYPNAWTAIAQLLASNDSTATQGALMGVFPEARDHVETAVEEVLAGRGNVTEALKKASDRTEKSLERYNRRFGK